MTKETKDAMLGGLVGICGAIAIVLASIVSTVNHTQATMAHHDAPAKAAAATQLVLASL